MKCRLTNRMVSKPECVMSTSNVSKEYLPRYGVYKINDQDQWSTLTCDASTFSQNPPLFVHSYVQKTFGAIPNLHIAEPFSGKFAYSAMYYLSNCLLPGMLRRYFPTHWISLIQGERGDALWPTINRAQQFVENSYPELVVEMIFDMIYENEENQMINVSEKVFSKL